MDDLKTKIERLIFPKYQITENDYQAGYKQAVIECLNIIDDTLTIANCVHCGAPILQGEKTHKNADGISKELMCQGCYDELRRDNY